jgi:hypothetical protein
VQIIPTVALKKVFRSHQTAGLLQAMCTSVGEVVCQADRVQQRRATDLEEQGDVLWTIPLPYLRAQMLIQMMMQLPRQPLHYLGCLRGLDMGEISRGRMLRSGLPQKLAWGSRCTHPMLSGLRNKSAQRLLRRDSVEASCCRELCLRQERHLPR